MLRKCLVVVLCCSLFAASHPAEAQDRNSGTSTVVPGEVEEVWDPFEPVNRRIFWFNDKFDRYILEPTARGYNSVMPKVVQEKIGNFFYNVQYPSRLLSDVIQLKFTQAAQHTGRFLINTTLGIGGLFDVASEFGIERHDEDLATAFAYIGIPAGPYLVLPFLGPSTLRDTVGLAGDRFLDPVYWVAYHTADSDDAFFITAGVTAIEVINKRARLLEAVDAAREASLDEYLFIQGAYYQYRAGLVYDGQVVDPLGDISESEDDFLEEGFDDFEEFDEVSRLAAEPGDTVRILGTGQPVDIAWYLAQERQ